MSQIITILCADDKSSYFDIPDLDIYTLSRNAFNYNGKNPVIAHPPCGAFSKMRGFSKRDSFNMELAEHCLNAIHNNCGILEQPAYSIMFELLGIQPTISVDQKWFGFRARKQTWLYLYNVELISHPITFDAATHKVENLTSSMRARQTIEFSQWLVDSVRCSINLNSR